MKMNNTTTIEIKIYIKGKRNPIVFLTNDLDRFDKIFDALNMGFIKISDAILNCQEIRYIVRKEK